MSTTREVPDGTNGESPLQHSTLIEAVTKVITLWPEHAHQLRLITKWRFEDEHEIHTWYGTIENTDYSSEGESTLDVNFAFDIASARGSTFCIQPLEPEHRLAFPYPHVACSPHVELPPVGEQHVVYYRVIIVIDDRADRGLLDKDAKVPGYYFLQKNGFLEGKLGDVTVSRTMPSAPVTPTQSEVDVDEIDAEDMAEAMRVVANSRYNSLSEQLTSLQDAVRKLVIKGASDNSAEIDEWRRNVDEGLEGLVREVHQVQDTIGDIHARFNSMDRRMQRMEDKQRADSNDTEALRTRCARLQQQIARQDAAPSLRNQDRTTLRLRETKSATTHQDFDPYVAASFPVQRTPVNEFTFKLIVDNLPFHKKIGAQARDELFKVWDQRYTAVSSVIAAGGDPAQISDEYEDKLQRWATCLKAIVREAPHNNEQTLRYIVDVTGRHTIDAPADQDVETLVTEAEAQYQLRGPKKQDKPKKPAPKVSDKDKDKDKTATDKGGSSGNGTGGR
ncbi:MAG: hypothetical protein GY906_10640 [bacterium]|jgi:hypothetical protein|nr:hypothetical protein [bacterium]